MKYLRNWQSLLRWAITLGGLVYAGMRVEWRPLGLRIAQAEIGWVMAAVLLSLGVIMLMAVRWRSVLRACDVRVSLGATSSVTFTGQFFNSFLPGSTGGDVVKAWHATRWAPDRKAAPAVSVLYDRAIAILTLLIVTTAVLGIQASAHEELRWLFERFGVLALGAVAGLGVFYCAARAWGENVLTRFPLSRPIKKVLAGCRLSPDSTRHFLAALAVSIPAHLANVGAAWCVAHAVHLDVNFLMCAVAVAFVNFSSVLPVSIGGHGLREAGFIFIFTLYGVLGSNVTNGQAVEAVLAFSILFFARSLIAALPGGLCYLTFKRTRAAELEQSAETAAA